MFIWGKKISFLYTENKMSRLVDRTFAMSFEFRARTD